MPCITKETKHYTKTTNTGRNTNILHTTKPPRREEKKTTAFKKEQIKEKGKYTQKEQTDKIKNIFHFYPILFAHEIFLPYLCNVKQKDHIV